MGFPVRISITLDLILVTTREKVASWKIFCSFIHDFLGVNNIEDLFCVNFNAKKKNYLHAIIANKNYSNTRKGNFSLAPHHLQGRKLTCQLKIK